MKILRIIKKTLYPGFRYLIHRINRWQKASLDFTLWGLGINIQGHLVIGECDTVELAKRYGTPLHVVDKDLLQKNYQEFYESFKSHNIDFEIYYSYKTNTIPAILQVLHENGAGAEVISPYELWLALELNVNPNLIIYNGPNKPAEGLKLAIEHGIKMININSFGEIDRIENIARELGKKPKVGVRIFSGVGWESQFGFGLKSGEALRAFEKLSKISCVEVAGIQIHLGTLIKNTDTFEVAIENIFKFINEIKDKLGICIKYVDLGGGFGVPAVKSFGRIEARLHRHLNKAYLPPNIKKAPSMREFANKIVNAVQRECERYKLRMPVLLFEPGRAITSNAQILLAKVGDVKEGSEGLKIAFIDGGINVANPLIWEYHEIFVANKMNSHPEDFYRLAGSISSPADLLNRNKKLPRLEVGDIISIMDAGAYFMSFSINFPVPRPAMVMVSESKNWVVRERETYEDMTHLEKFHKD